MSFRAMNDKTNVGLSQDFSGNTLASEHFNYFFVKTSENYPFKVLMKGFKENWSHLFFRYQKKTGINDRYPIS